MRINDPFAVQPIDQAGYEEWMSASISEADPAALVAEAQRRARATGWDVMFILCHMLGVKYNPNEADQTFDYIGNDGLN